MAKNNTKKKEQKQNTLRRFSSQGFLRMVESDGDTVEYAFVISNSNSDRHGTVVPMERWKLDNYRANNVVFYMHESSSYWEKPDPDYLIGHSRVEIEGDNLVGYVTFEPEDINALAEKIRKKVEFGTLKSASVGFDPISAGHWGEERDGEDPDLYYFGDVDLLEWSIVNIPSNASANKIDKSLKRFMRNQKRPTASTKKSIGLHSDLLSVQNSVLKHRNFLNKY